MVKKFAVFASGNGSNLQAIIDAVKAGVIKADLALVFSDRRKAHALERAQAAGIATLHIDPKMYTNRQSFEREVVIKLKEYEIDFIVLAGYMRLVSAYFLKQFPQKILNIHPSLLPSFRGIEGIKDAWIYGVKVTGVTVHFVDEKADHGPVILQEAVSIDDSDTLETLEAKIHGVEHKLYPRAVALLAEDRLKIKGRKVEIKM